MKREPILGDRVRVVWADIWEAMDTKPEDHAPRVYEAKEGTFLGWKTMAVRHRGIRCDLEYCVVSGGDRDVLTNEERNVVAYPRGCVLGITVLNRRKPTEVDHGSGN